MVSSVSAGVMLWETGTETTEELYNETGQIWWLKWKLMTKALWLFLKLGTHASVLQGVHQSVYANASHQIYSHRDSRMKNSNLNSRVHIVSVIWHYLPFTELPIVTSFTLPSSSSLINIFKGALEKSEKNPVYMLSVLSFDIPLHVCGHVTETGLCLSYNTTKTRVNILLYSKHSRQPLTSAYALLLARQDPWGVNNANALQNLVGHLWADEPGETDGESLSPEMLVVSLHLAVDSFDLSHVITTETHFLLKFFQRIKLDTNNKL